MSDSILHNKIIKIAYLSDSEVPSYRANTVHVMKMCSALSKMGTEVTLFCNISFSYNESKLRKSFGVGESFQIKAISAKLKGKFRLIELALRKANLVKHGEYTFCYGRSLLALFFIRKKIPFIYESHILPNRSVFVRLEQKLLRNKNCRQLVVISQSLKDEYLKLFSFLKSQDITVLHDGADVFDGTFNRTDAPLELIEAHQAGPTIGYIGHLYPGKCMEVMMQIAKKMPEQVFHVIGGTEEWVSHWKNKCFKDQIENIKFYGFIDNSKVIACYQYIDIVVLPFSDKVYYNRDKKDDIGRFISPLKLFEAMSCGKAIIASKLVSIEEVVENNKNAILVPPSDINLWCSSISELISNPELRKELGRQAEYKLRHKYSWMKRAEKILGLISMNTISA